MNLCKLLDERARAHLKSLENSLKSRCVLYIKSLLLHWNCGINFYRHSVLLNKQALTVHKYFFDICVGLVPFVMAIGIQARSILVILPFIITQKNTQG